MDTSDPNLGLAIAALVGGVVSWFAKRFLGGGNTPVPAPDPNPAPGPAPAAPTRPLATGLMALLLDVAHAPLTDAQKAMLGATFRHLLDEWQIPAPFGKELK